MYEMRSEVRWGMLGALIVIVGLVVLFATTNCNKEPERNSFPFTADNSNSGSEQLANNTGNATERRPVPNTRREVPRTAPVKTPPPRPQENRVSSRTNPPTQQPIEDRFGSPENANVSVAERREANRVDSLIEQSSDDDDGVFDPVGRSYENDDDAEMDEMFAENDNENNNATDVTTIDPSPTTMLPPRVNLPTPTNTDEPRTSIEKLVNPDDGLVGAQTYTVKDGDTLSDIAADFYGHGKYYLALAAANPEINPDVVIPGTKLVIPDKEAVLAGRVKKQAAPKPNKPQPQSQANSDSADARRATYRVGKGDTLEGIARKLLGDGKRWPEIYELNKDKLKSPDVVPLGMDLRIPKKDAPVNRNTNTNASPRREEAKG